VISRVSRSIFEFDQKSDGLHFLEMYRGGGGALSREVRSKIIRNLPDVYGTYSSDFRMCSEYIY
jgi:hypothetical protein